MINRVTLVGHLGRDPEVRSMQSGDRVANLSLATSESWKDKSTGDRRERTEWHRITVFNPGLVTVTERYLQKGSQVYLEGQIETRKWQDQEGNDRYSTEIVLRPYKSELRILSGGRQQDSTQAAPAESVSPSGALVDDDIPF